MRAKICDFLDSVGLYPEKTKITNINKEKALFLGTHITRAGHTTRVKIQMKHPGDSCSDNAAAVQKPNPRRLRLTAPLPRIRKKLAEAGFMRKNQAHPKFVWMHMSHAQILDRYNAVLGGFLNYYSFAHNYGRMCATTTYYLKYSCGKLLAAKYSLGTYNRVAAKYGKDLACPSSGSTFMKPSYITLKLYSKTSPDGRIRALYSYQPPSQGPARV